MINKIAFIGAGSMAEAIIAGIIKKGFLKSKQLVVTNRKNENRLNFLRDTYQIQCTHEKKHVIENAEIIILSIKPADMKSAMDSIKNFIKPNQLIVSVVAGVSSDDITKLIGKDVAVIRAMPNTSAAVGYSATAISKGENALDKHIEMSKQLFKTIGTTVVIAEKDMHAVTGLSGSGPAYVYYFAEAMENVAIELGFDQEMAKSLITQTIIGAGQMLQQSGQSAETLRDNVTSPGGTTEAGIKILDKFNTKDAIVECVKAAREKSIEIGKK